MRPGLGREFEYFTADLLRAMGQASNALLRKSSLWENGTSCVSHIARAHLLSLEGRRHSGRNKQAQTGRGTGNVGIGGEAVDVAGLARSMPLSRLR